MISPDKIAVLSKWGYTDKQAELLATAAFCGGYFTARHVDRIVSNGFLARALKSKHVSEITMSRSKLYYISQSEMYEALGVGGYRNRGHHSWAERQSRVMALDYVQKNCGWSLLETEAAKIAWMQEHNVLKDCLPKKTYKPLGSLVGTTRYFPEGFPIAIDQQGDPVLSYVDSGSHTIKPWETWLTHHAGILSRLSQVTVMHVCNRYDFMQAAKRVFDARILVQRESTFKPETREMLRYFDLRRKMNGATLSIDELQTMHTLSQKHSGDKASSLYEAWKQRGNAVVLEAVGDGASGAVLDFCFLPHNYVAFQSVIRQSKRGLSDSQPDSTSTPETTAVTWDDVDREIASGLFGAGTTTGKVT